MINIKLDNKYIYLQNIPKILLRTLINETSYLVAGYKHSNAFIENRWDGKKRLLIYSKSENCFKAPVGLAEKIVSIIELNGVEWSLNDKRVYPNYNLDLGKISGLRPYQKLALDAATTQYGYLKTVGRGIIKLPARSGKTLTAAAIISKLGVKTLFVVPSQLLLYQTQKAISNVLKIETGIIGDGMWEPANVTVSTAQTLVVKRGTKEYRELLDNSDLLIVDEFHHITGDMWRNISLDSPAPYKIGLSATVFIDNEKECELGVIWLRACSGEILIDISVSELIRMGYLVRPKIIVIPLRTPDMSYRGWSQKLHKDAIWNNEKRNKIIADIAYNLSLNENRRIVIVSNRLQQVDILHSIIEELNISCAKITGKTPQIKRNEIITEFKNNNISVLIGTVLSEGVDIPEIDCVINAEGGRNIKATYQRMRCLTLCSGKKDAVFVDFIDMMHPYFAQHSKERLDVYRSESEFNIEILENYDICVH